MKAGDTGRYSAVRRESQPHVEEVEASPLSYAEQAGRVTLQHGRFRVSLPITLALALVTCLGGYFGSRAQKPAESDPSALLLEFRTAMSTQAAAAELRSQQLDHRLDVVETNLSVIRGSIDTMRDRLNDKR